MKQQRAKSSLHVPKSTQVIRYIDADMQMERVSLRLSKMQREQVRALAERLQLDETNVIRLAVTRLAQLEGVIKAPPIWEMFREQGRKEDGVP